MTDEQSRVVLSGGPHEGTARLVLLELDRASQGQDDRWVMVHVLQRSTRLPLDGPSLRAALDHARSMGWVELDAKRVRLLDLGRALVGRRRSRVAPMKRHW